MMAQGIKIYSFKYIPQCHDTFGRLDKSTPMTVRTVGDFHTGIYRNVNDLKQKILKVYAEYKHNKNPREGWRKHQTSCSFPVFRAWEWDISKSKNKELRFRSD